MTDAELLEKIERARKAAHLFVEDMLPILNVTKPSYYNWLKKEGMVRLRKKNRASCEDALRMFIVAFRSGDLPVNDEVTKAQRQAIVKNCAARVASNAQRVSENNATE